MGHRRALGPPSPFLPWSLLSVPYQGWQTPVIKRVESQARGCILTTSKTFQRWTWSGWDTLPAKVGVPTAIKWGVGWSFPSP